MAMSGSAVDAYAVVNHQHVYMHEPGGDQLCVSDWRAGFSVHLISPQPVDLGHHRVCRAVPSLAG